MHRNQRKPKQQWRPSAARKKETFQKERKKPLRNSEHEVAEFENVVISCGGGTPCFFDNMDYMNQQAQVVYLKATPEVLFSHLAMSKNERPLLKGKSHDELIAFISEQLQHREQYYLKAKYQLDVTVMDSGDKIRSNIERLKELLG